MFVNKIIIDTDIGSDVDDAMALSLAINSNEINLIGVTTVYGDTTLRAKLAKKLLQLGGSEHIPVCAGIEKPLLHNREVWWSGHEGEGVLTDETITFETEHAVDFIIRTIMENPGEISLIPIGPLTNIAAAIIREPQIVKNLKEIVLMGGVSRLGDNGLELPPIEHNIKCDPESASLVFSSGAPIVMVGLDVTMKVRINRDDIKQLEDSGRPLNLALVKLINRWLEYIKLDWTAMHDPLAVSVLIDRSIVQTKRMNVKVQYDHQHPSGQTIATLDEAGNVEVCLNVDNEKFKELLFRKLLGGKTTVPLKGLTGNL
jgi:purine nucleosidase